MTDSKSADLGESQRIVTEEAACAPMETVLKHSQDGDDALKAIEGGLGEIVEIDEATNKRLLRKIDLHILPLLFVVYLLNFLDKLTLSYASIMGIKKDLHLKGEEYSWLSSMFYFGYLIWEMPTARLLQRLPLAKYSAFNIFMWGLVLACFAAAKNFSGTLALRFFLGLFESSVTPGFALFTSQWYTKAEQGSRTGLWFCSNGFAQILGGLIAYGIAHQTEIHGSAIEPWKILFLATGIFTALTGIVFYFFMPDSQLNAWFLTPEERVLAIARIRVNQQGVGNKHFKWYQMREALCDPLTWAFFLFAITSSIPNGGMSGFFSQLIVSFGYTPQQSLLYGTPAGAIGAVSLLLNGILGDRLRNRILVSSTGLIIAIVGMILIVALPLHNNGGRLAGYYLSQTAPMAFVNLLSLVSTNVAGYTKKTFVAGLYLIGYCVGNIVGPQTFRSKDAPRYVPAEITIIVLWGVSFIDLLLIYAYCRYQNRKKAEIRSQTGYIKLENQEFLDLTDRENPAFIYTL